MTVKCLLTFRISELKEEYKEEEITQKGYVKKLRLLLASHLMDSQQEKITNLEEELSQEEITEVSKCSVRESGSFAN